MEECQEREWSCGSRSTVRMPRDGCVWRRQARYNGIVICINMIQTCKRTLQSRNAASQRASRRHQPHVAVRYFLLLGGALPRTTHAS